MNTTDLVHFPTADVPPRQAPPKPALAPSRHELAAPVRSSILRGRSDLVDRQRLDGSWATRKTGDVASLVQLVLLDAYLGRAPSEIADHSVAAILRRQHLEGGWSLAPGGPIDLDASVLAYFALKLVGEDASRPAMSRARQAIRMLGGADACTAATRLWWALLGQIEYEHCPPIAPEWLLTAAYKAHLSADDERRLAAYAVVWATRPRREIELARGIRELFVEPPQNWPAPANYFAEQPPAVFAGFWTHCERFGLLPLRNRALERANFLLTEAAIESADVETSCGEFVWRRIALSALGHAEHSRVITACDRLREQFAGAEPDDARSRPETSLTADTALAIEALIASGTRVEDDPIAAGVDWLLTHRLQPSRQVKPASEVAALFQALSAIQAFDESTASVLPPNIQLAVDHSESTSIWANRRPATQLEQLADPLLREALELQQADGGWEQTNCSFLNRRPRGVIRATVRRRSSPSDATSTGTMLEWLSRRTRRSNTTPIARGAAFLHSVQRGDGSWQSADALHPVSATAAAIRGLIAAGGAPTDPVIAAGVNWLLVQQHTSGGWSDARESSDDAGDDADDSSVTETASAMLALISAGLADHEATRRGVDFLIARDSTMLTNSNDLHSSAWSMIALARWAVAIDNLRDDDAPSHLRLICGDLAT